MAGIALAVTYVLAAVLACAHLVRGARRTVRAGGRVGGSFAFPALFALAALGAMVLLSDPADRLMTLGVAAAFPVAAAIGTRGRPFDFVDAHRREGLGLSLPRGYAPSERAVRRTQYRVLAWFAVLAAAAAAAAYAVA